MREVYLNAGINRELLVFAHLFALIVRKGFGEFPRQGAELSRVCAPHTLGILGFERDEDGLAGRTLHERAECAVRLYFPRMRSPSQ